MANVPTSSPLPLYRSKTCANVTGFTQPGGSKRARRNAIAGFAAVVSAMDSAGPTHLNSSEGYELYRLRKKAWIRAKSLKSIPQGLKRPLILLGLYTG
jgi:hypothetical protein